MIGVGLAEFKFKFTDIAQSGSDAKVTFWPGDASNNTYGPFSLNMDYVNNINLNSITYSYSSRGNFTACFLFSNILGSYQKTLEFLIIPALDGFFIDVIPKSIVKLTPVTVNAYVIQGDNVNYTWYLDGKFLFNRKRQGNIVQILC